MRKLFLSVFNFKNNLNYNIMKAKTILLGLVFFVIGMVVTFGIESGSRHHNFKDQVQIRKSTVIEVGAPLTVMELKHQGFI